MKKYTPVITVVAIALAGFLLYRALDRYSFDQVVASVTAIPRTRLLAAGGFAAASYVCLTGFDALGVRYAGRPLAYGRVALASFTALSIGHNLGFAALSSGAVRYRFYRRWGLTAEEVARLIVFCGATVGLGLLILAGSALLLHPGLAERASGLSRATVLGLGMVCLVLAGSYVVLAALVRRPLRLRHWTFTLPGLRLALGQAVVGTVNFTLVAACLHQVLAAVAEVSYPAVASAYAIANATALVAHVPGGLGVIEGVVLLLLPGAEIFGALVVFRFVYFLVPLAIGGTTFLVSEAVWRTLIRSRG
jgi:glycosyltransferase 2 family protein